MTSYDITNVDAGHYCATFYGEGRVWKLCTLKEASGTDQSLLELRISTQTSPTIQNAKALKSCWKFDRRALTSTGRQNFQNLSQTGVNCAEF